MDFRSEQKDTQHSCNATAMPYTTGVPCVAVHISFRLKWHRVCALVIKNTLCTRKTLLAWLGGDSRKEGGLGCGTEGN